MTPPATGAGHDPLGLVRRSHKLRNSLAQEMHLREFPEFAAPARLLQVVTLLGEGGGAASHAHLVGLTDAAAEAVPAETKHAQIMVDGFELVWERHAEFATYTFVLPGPFDMPFDIGAFLPAGRVLGGMPGEVLRATVVALLPVGSEAAGVALAAGSFGSEGLIDCLVADGKARIWSDFRLDQIEGVGRLLIADRALGGGEPARIVQQLQELGNYRNLALLGLPVAQRLAPELARLERRLAGVTEHVADPARADEPLLEELTDLSAELARLVADTRYRTSATRAYAQIVAERLASLEVGALPGRRTLTDFTDRRLMPAVRTCAAMAQRLEDLSQRASWASSLLRTRIDTALARQSRDLLGSMDRRTHLQLRLQQAVEGLSVVAISYYIVALLSYVVKAVHWGSPELVLAILVPFVVAAVALGLARLHRRIDA